MKKTSNLLWGVVLIIAGVIWALNGFNITSINLFFKGWWTLFIFVPCCIGLFSSREKTDSIIGIIITVVLFLCCQGLFSFALLWKLLLPAVAIIIGLKLIISGFLGKKANEIMKKLESEGKEAKSYCATFSGCNLNFDDTAFEGAELTAVFGGIKCDLRNAVIDRDCVIQVSAIFGGIDILVPDNINVKSNSTSIFGGVSIKTAQHKDVPTIYINGTCMFGGVEIK